MLTDCWCASALGRGQEETLANYDRRFAPGMTELEGDVPSRRIRFGMVPGPLPEVAEPEFRMRCCSLLALAAENMRGTFERLVSRYGAERTGIVIGASNTGIDEAQGYISSWLDIGGGRKPAELDFSMIELGTPAEFLRRISGAKGPAYSVSTACSSSGKAFAAARRLIEAGIADAVITGGVDGRCRFAMNGFNALNALSEGECRPLSPGRDGINLGEGVALFALERGGEGVALAGVGESSDAYHPTAPDPEGRGAESAMSAAMEEADWAPEDIKELNQPMASASYPRPSGLVSGLTKNVHENQACSACYAALVRALNTSRCGQKEKIYIGQGWQGGKLDGLGIGKCCRGAEDCVMGCPPTAEQIAKKLEELQWGY